jgi:hypothetical protein
MSKKKGKAAPKKAPKMAPRKKSTSRPAARPASRTSLSRTSATTGGNRTVNATIFIFRTGNGIRIRTTPQRLYANVGDRVQWTVVNTVDGSDIPVTVTWPEGGPWGKEPIEIKSFAQRVVDGGPGTSKYVVSAYDAQEDPEVEIPDIP